VDEPVRRAVRLRVELPPEVELEKVDELPDEPGRRVVPLLTAAVALAIEGMMVAPELRAEVMLAATELNKAESVATAEGTRMVWTSVGRLVNQAGVEPAANSEAMSEYRPDGSARASDRTEEGSPVWRTERTERVL